MKNVTKIDQVDLSIFKKLRVAAYCRVSTDSNEQELSLDTQKNHYESYIKANSEWEYAGIYYDDGISGTKTAKRDGLLRLVEDCEKGLIDLVITKSISRFSRNTTDCLALVRKLLNYDVYIIFEKENIHTGSMESELMLPRQLFMQVQEELLRRAHLKTENGKTKRVYSSKYALSSIVYCGKCGDLFRRVAWKARGASYNKWRCASRIEKGPKEGCDADAISEVELQNAVVRAINKTLGGREQFLVQLQHNIEDVLNGDSTATLEYIDQRMAELQEKLVMCVNKNAEYDVIANEIDALREKKAAVVTRDAEQEMLRKRIDEMRQFLQSQTNRVTEYDEQMVRRLIEKITVFDDKLIFEFKSGMTLELKR